MNNVDARECCYQCGKDVDLTIVQEIINMEIKGVEFEFIGKVAYCSSCGEEIFITELDENNIKKANEEYRKQVDIIQVDEIKTLLREYNIGYKPLSILLGWGETTISRYLNGLTPSREYSKRLKELNDPYNMQDLLKMNGHLITKIAREKVEKSIEKILGFKNNGKNNSNVIEISKYFLSKVDVESGDFITHLKLQKLVYYAQAWGLVLLNKELIVEDFQAWIHGPVVPELYNVYRGFGMGPLPKVTFNEKNKFDIETQFILDGIWHTYGKYNAKYLETLTHSEEPWKLARGECKRNDRCTNIIGKKSIKNYYSLVKNINNIKTMEDLDNYVSSIKIKNF